MLYVLRQIVTMAEECLPPLAKRFCTAATSSETRRNRNGVMKIAVEGNIATGKSTFLNILSSHTSRYHVISEPLTRWTNVSGDEGLITSSQKFGGNLLDSFYKDPKRWAYTFQTYACLSRLRAQLRPIPEELMDKSNLVLFYERSVYSDKFCFAQNCHETGLFSDTEWDVYCDWHSFLLESLPLEFDGFIFLKSSPEVCLERLKQRNRPEELDVTLDYLECLNKKHENWLVHKLVKPPESAQADVPVLYLDCDIDFEHNKDQQNILIKEVEAYIERLRQ